MYFYLGYLTNKRSVNTMIPKTIHYCWFGKNPKSKLANKCIKSWEEKCKGYEIIEWNEDNFDVSKCPLYVRQAYDLKKWAFVTDYIRLKVVYDNGGIYFDTDVQVLKSFDELLSCHSFFGFENLEYVNTGVGFGAEKGNSILREIMDQYQDITFLLNDDKIDTMPCPQRNTEVFKSHGLIQDGSTQVLNGDIHIFAKDFFNPIDYRTHIKHITHNTYSIHWFEASWYSEEDRKNHIKEIRLIQKNNRKHFIKTIPNRFLIKLMGRKKYEGLKNKIHKTN